MGAGARALTALDSVPSTQASRADTLQLQPLSFPSEDEKVTICPESQDVKKRKRKSKSGCCGCLDSHLQPGRQNMGILCGKSGRQGSAVLRVHRLWMATGVFFLHGGDANHLYHKGLGLPGSAMYLLDINGQEPELISHPPAGAKESHSSASPMATSLHPRDKHVLLSQWLS